MKQAAAFSFVEMLVTAAVIGVLALVVIPIIMPGPTFPDPMAGALSNARQLHLATQTMTLDTSNGGGTGPEWTVSVDAKGRITTATARQYFDALVKGGYLTGNDLRHLLTAARYGPGSSTPTAANSCFKIFAVDESSPANQPLLVTANWDAGKLTSNPPFGTKGFVEFTKNGSGGIYRGWGDADSTKIFPIGKDAAGHAYSDEVLK